MKITLLSLFTFLTLPLLAESTKVALESALEPVLSEGNLRIIYTSSGCFHHESYELTFKMLENASLEVSVVENVRELNDSSESAQISHEPIGAVILQGRDLDRLGKLIEYYDSLEDVGCTTVDHIVFQKVQTDIITVITEIYDASCGTHDRLDVLTLGEIVHRAKQAVR